LRGVVFFDLRSFHSHAAGEIDDDGLKPSCRSHIHELYTKEQNT